MSFWQTSRRRIPLDRPIVMGIINITPDSFSDGGLFLSPDNALNQAERLLAEGADILDVGGESTRPGSSRVLAEEEMSRVIPVIEAIASRFDVPISIDTSKASVAAAAVGAGAEIINDISGLRFDEQIAGVAADSGAGIVLMHSRGEFESMHTQAPLADILAHVSADFRRSTRAAIKRGINPEQIVLDVGIGFGKTADQNLELIAKLDRIADEFSEFPLLVGASRKSFIGRVLAKDDPADRDAGSLAAAVLSVWNGASIVRVHDVRPAADALKVVAAIKSHL